MSAHSDRPVKTYAIGFAGGDAESYYNELPYARRVADLFHTDHHEILVRPDAVSLLPHLLWHMGPTALKRGFTCLRDMFDLRRRLYWIAAILLALLVSLAARLAFAAASKG